MLILVPMPIINNITGKQEGKTISLIPFDLLSIKSIDEDIEDNNVIIKYKTIDGSPNDLKLDILFIDFIKPFINTGIVDFTHANKARLVSKSLDTYLKELTK
jgi:hypothetical protein